MFKKVLFGYPKEQLWKNKVLPLLFWIKNSANKLDLLTLSTASDEHKGLNQILSCVLKSFLAIRNRNIYDSLYRVLKLVSTKVF